MEVVISGYGYNHPPEAVSNEELTNAYNEYVDIYNIRKKSEIADGKVSRLQKSSPEFIKQASGIQSRYVRDKKNLLNPNILFPKLKQRDDNEISLQAEVSIDAARKSLATGQKHPQDIDCVIISSSHKQRDFPSVSIEVQNELGATGFAFDMGVACSSATYGIQAAYAMIVSGSATSVLLISPEIKSGQFDMRDRSSNFIFGEATSALLLERSDISKAKKNLR